MREIFQGSGGPRGLSCDLYSMGLIEYFVIFEVLRAYLSQYFFGTYRLLAAGMKSLDIGALGTVEIILKVSILPIFFDNGWHFSTCSFCHVPLTFS